MQVTGFMYLVVLPMVFLASLIDSISGGGGLISLPAYTMAGLNYDFASGNNKFSSTFGTLMATVRYARAGRIMWLPALYAIIGALPGAYLGTVAAMRLGSQIMSVVMVVAIPVIGVFVALRRNEEVAPRPFNARAHLFCVGIGLAIGFYDGFFGPATGTFLILLFNYITGMDLVTASATAKPVNLASNIASLVTRILAGSVIYPLAIPAVVCSVAGGFIGSKLALTKGARFVRYVMLGVLAILTVKLAIDLIV